MGHGRGYDVPGLAALAAAGGWAGPLWPAPLDPVSRAELDRLALLLLGSDPGTGAVPAIRPVHVYRGSADGRPFLLGNVYLVSPISPARTGTRGGPAAELVTVGGGAFCRIRVPGPWPPLTLLPEAEPARAALHLRGRSLLVVRATRLESGADAELLLASCLALARCLPEPPLPAGPSPSHGLAVRPRTPPPEAARFDPAGLHPLISVRARQVAERTGRPVTREELDEIIDRLRTTAQAEPT